MKKALFIIIIIVVLCSGCQSLMHKTIAEQVIQIDKNCKTLLTNYKNWIIAGSEPKDKEFEVALIDATLVLTNDVKLSAEQVIKEKK